MGLRSFFFYAKKNSHTTGTKFLPKIALCNLNCRDDSRTPPSNSAELLLLRSHLRSRHFLFYIPPLLLLLFPPHDQRGGGCGKVNRQIRLSKQRRRRRMAAMMSSNNSREGHTLILNYCRGDRFCGFSGGERHTHASAARVAIWVPVEVLPAVDLAFLVEALLI